MKQVNPKWCRKCEAENKRDDKNGGGVWNRQLCPGCEFRAGYEAGMRDAYALVKSMGRPR